MAKSATKNSGHQIPKEQMGNRKKYIFIIITILLPFFFIGLIEIGLRIFTYGSNIPMFVDTEMYGREYLRCNPEYGKKYFSFESYTLPHNDVFLKEKPEDGFRIFVLGSSTVYGFPYGAGAMFSRILHKRLEDSFPDKLIEVVNTAITAINSYTFADRIDEILNQQPDAILIYAGHNEFYGALGIGSNEGFGSSMMSKRLHLFMLDFRTYQALQSAIHRLRSLATSSSSEQVDEAATLMARIARNKNIPYQGHIYRKAHKQFEANMNKVLRKAVRKNVPVFFSEVISNYRDLEPLGACDDGLHPPSIEVFRQAQLLDSLGQYEQAKDKYILAKDLDCIRFRASEEINHIIRRLINKHQATLVPMKSWFERESPAGIIGNNLLTEHVHPRQEGYFLMADAFFDAIAKSQLIGHLDSTNYLPSQHYQQVWYFTRLDSLVAELRLKHLMNSWPFKPLDQPNTFKQTYTPQTALDSVAFMAMVYNDFTLEMAHQRMAAYYLARNELIPAAKEYLSITTIDPTNLRAYIEAGNLLHKAGESEHAKRILTASLKLTREYPVIMQLAEINLQLHAYDQVIAYLGEIAKAISPEDTYHYLSMLYEAYMATGQEEKALAIRTEKEALNQPGENNQRTIVYTPANVRTYIDQALKQLQSNQLQEGLKTLLEANQIEESSLANRLIGEIYLQLGDQRALHYLKNALRDYQADPVFLNTLCYAAISFRDFVLAQQILSDLRQINPDNPSIPNYQAAIRQGLDR